MNIFFYTCLFVFGMLLWSFWSVIIFRFKSWEWWILNWRSHCPNCNKVLEALDLIPVFSWLLSKAKCGNCKEKISAIYPILELSTWLLFMLIWYFLIDYNQIFAWNWLEISKLVFWIIIWFISIIYTFYDIIFLEIHEWVLLTWIMVIFLALSIQTISTDFNLIEVLPTWIDKIGSSMIWYLSIWVAAIIIWILYLIMLQWFHELVDISLVALCIVILYIFKTLSWYDLSEIAILDWVAWALWIYIFFFIQIIVSRWTWMWGWDLRIAIMIWLILWISLSFAWLMLTYFVWSIIWVAVLVYNKLKNKWKKINTQIPFWPFLAIWFFLTIFYSNQISNLISIYFW